MNFRRTKHFCHFIVTISALASSALAPSARADDANGPRFELLHLWGSGGEIRALAKYSDAMKERGVHWMEHSVYNKGHGVRRMLATRLASGLPPTAVFWHAGESSTRMIREGYFQEIPLQFGKVNFETALRPEVLEVLRFGDGINLVPIGNHIVHRIYYNQAILDELGAAPARSWREFLELADRAKAAGYPALVVSDQRWQNLYPMLSILVESLTIDEMARFVAGREPPELFFDQLRDAAEVLIQLRDHINSDISDLSWDMAISKVYNKESMAYITGDFGSALIPEDDGTVLCSAPPGNSYVLWSLDAAALMITDDPREVEGQHIFAEIVSSPELHSQYIVEKGGVSAYLGTKSDGIDACTRASLEDWNKSKDKLFIPSEAWIRVFYLLADATNSIWASSTITAEDAAMQAVTALAAGRPSETLK